VALENVNEWCRLVHTKTWADTKDTTEEELNMTWNHNYRQLGEGEIIRESDEIQIDKPFGWRLTNERCVGTKAPSPLYTSHRIYRRYITHD
jgi:hypothetical protein